MKKILPFIVFLLGGALISAQVPESFSYQVIVRDASNNPITNQNVSFRMSILKGNISGSTVFKEKHIAITNDLGLVTLAIGDGTEQTGSIVTIDWGVDDYFLKVEIDPTGGSGYVVMGTTQLLSVPYARYARFADTAFTYFENDPVFILHPSYGISSGNISDWTDAHSWGNHAAAGYLTDFTETDPKVGVNTTNYLSKWDGSALVSSTISDNGLIGIGTSNPSALMDLNIPNNFPYSGLNISMPDVSNQTLNHKALTISSSWDAEGIVRSNIFSVEDEESSPIMTLRRLGYNYLTVLAPGSISFIGENGNNFSMNWEEGFSYGTSTSGYNIQINTETPFYYRTYSGGWIDLVRITNQGNAYFTGNLHIGAGTTNPSAALDVASTTSGFLPPRMTEEQRDAITPAEGLIVYNTTSQKPNYYNGTKWKNFDGTLAETPEIGDSFQGGIVAYILQFGDPGYIPGETHGIIVAPSDHGQAQWGCSGSVVSAAGTALGTGLQNTLNIVNNCSTAGIAARICNDLELNGYNDWYLPSRDELEKLYINQSIIGVFPGVMYWSSTEVSSTQAKFIYMDATGFPFNDGLKGATYIYVRAIRSF